MYNSKKQAQSSKTCSRLVAAARPLFETRGFDGISAEEIVAAAGVTRGALYHHFEGKKGLFEAVASEAMSKLHHRISKDVSGARNTRNTLERAIKAFLERTKSRRLQQLLFVDAPSVLGWARWRELDSAYGLGGLIGLIQTGVTTGEFQCAEPKVTAQLLLGAMIEGGLLIAANPNDSTLRQAVSDSLIQIIDGL